MPIYLQHGNLIDYVPPTDTSTEDVVFMGGLVGIPQAFIPAGELGALSVDGVYMFTKKDGVSVNLGEVVKYCGTTKLAQDSNADLTLGVAVADADADSLGVKVKINSVLPSSGGGGGGGSGGEVALCGASGLYFDGGKVAIKYCGNSAINADTNGVYLAICGASGLSIQDGQLVASGGGGGGGGESGESEVGFNQYDSLVSSTDYASTSYRCSVVLGRVGDTIGSSAVVIGSGASSCYGNVVIGYNSCAESSESNVVIGKNASVSACGSIAVGTFAKATTTNSGNGSIVIGDGTNPYSASALFVIGYNGNPDTSTRKGMLLVSEHSDYNSNAGIPGIAYVSSTDKGNNWTTSCFIPFN